MKRGKLHALRHYDEVTRLRRPAVIRKRERAGRDISESLVEGRQFLPHVDDVDVDGAAALCSKAGFDSGDYRSAQAASLRSWIDRQHPEVPAIPVRPSVDAGREPGSRGIGGL